MRVVRDSENFGVYGGRKIWEVGRFGRIGRAEVSAGSFGR
jgi:hypothetical protein